MEKMHLLYSSFQAVSQEQFFSFDRYTSPMVTTVKEHIKSHLHP